MAADNDFVYTSHHGKDSGVGNERCVDSFLRQFPCHFVPAEARCRFHDNDFKLSFPRCGLEELLYCSGATICHYHLTAYAISCESALDLTYLA